MTDKINLGMTFFLLFRGGGGDQKSSKEESYLFKEDFYFSKNIKNK